MILLDAQALAFERASFARDVEYLQSMAKDSDVNDAMLYAELYDSVFHNVTESVDEDDAEFVEAIDEIPINDGTEEAEIQRILNSDHDMDIDDVLGISDNNSDDVGEEEDSQIELADEMLDNECGEDY